MQGGAAAWQLRHDDRGRRAAMQQGVPELQHRRRAGAAADAEQHDTVADGHDVAAGQRCRAVVGTGVAPPGAESGVVEARVKAVDRRRKQAFAAP